MEEHQASALLSSRAALIGPYVGATLQAKEPPFNKPANLALWADSPRITACFTELIEGLLFDTDDQPQAGHAHPCQPAQWPVAEQAPSHTARAAQGAVQEIS